MTGYCLPADRSRANREDENSILGLNGLSAALLQRHGARVLYPPAAAASHDSGPPPRPTVYRAHTLFVPATLLQSAVRDALNAVLADVGMKLEAVGTDDEFKLPQLAVLVPAEPKGGDPVLPVVVDAWVALQALRAAARRNVQDLQQYQPEIDQIALEHILTGAIIGAPITDGGGIVGGPITDGGGVNGPGAGDSYLFSGADARTPVKLYLGPPPRKSKDECVALDLQTGTAGLGAELAATGLRLALDRGSARVVFAWLERSRAQAFRATPVRPPPDPHTAAALAALRQLSHRIRTAEVAGHRDTASITRRAELQRTLRERSWHAGGPGKVTPQATLAEVSAALQESQKTLAAILVLDGRILAIVAGAGAIRLVRLGDAGTAAEAARRLIADLDTLAGRRLPPGLHAVINESASHQAAVLTAEIVTPLLAELGDNDLVLAPPGVLAGIPWNMLPGLRGRPVTVCPSASSWLAAWRRAQSGPPAPAPAAPLLVAGPNLTHAPQEIGEIARIYHNRGH